MKRSSLLIGLSILSLCSCSSYQSISVNKAIEILESIEEYCSYDIPTNIMVSYRTEVFNNENNRIKLLENTYEMSYSRKRMHVLQNEDEVLVGEYFSGLKEEEYYIFRHDLFEGTDRYNKWNIDERIYGMLLLNYMGLLQNAFLEESNIGINLIYLDDYNDPMNKAKVRSKGKGSLELIYEYEGIRDNEVYTYEQYRLLNKLSTYYAINHDENSSYTLYENESYRTIFVELKYKGISIKVPDLDDYEDGDASLPSIPIPDDGDGGISIPDIPESDTN